MAALALALAAMACNADSEDASYLGIWDPVMLTHTGDVMVLENGGISFREDQACFIRFSEECHNAAYTQQGEVTAATMGGYPN